MEITLKKAYDLEMALSAASQKIHVLGSFPITVYEREKIGERVAEARESVKTQISDILELVEVNAELRSLKGSANAEHGINQLITKRKILETKIAKLTAIVSQLSLPNIMRGRAARVIAKTTEDNVVALAIGRLDTMFEKLNSKEPNPYGASREDSLNIEYADPIYLEMLDDQLSKLVRDKTEIQDQIAALNITNKIKISDQAVKVLQKYKIIS